MVRKPLFKILKSIHIKYIMEKSLLIIGISGVTCGGKTTTATQLKDLISNVTIFSQDYYYLDVEDPRHVWIPELNHINFDVITSLDMEKMYKDIQHFIDINNFKPVGYMNKIIFDVPKITQEELAVDMSKIVCNKIRQSNLNILIIEGFSIFNYKPMLNLFHLKYYFTLDREECFKRRIERVYEPPDCPGYFEKCAWPEHLDQLNDVKRNVEDVKYISGNSTNVMDIILKDVFKYLPN